MLSNLWFADTCRTDSRITEAQKTRSRCKRGFRVALPARQLKISGGWAQHGVKRATWRESQTYSYQGKQTIIPGHNVYSRLKTSKTYQHGCCKYVSTKLRIGVQHPRCLLHRGFVLQSRLHCSSLHSPSLPMHCQNTKFWVLPVS